MAYAKDLRDKTCARCALHAMYEVRTRQHRHHAYACARHMPDILAEVQAREATRQNPMWDTAPAAMIDREPGEAG